MAWMWMHKIPVLTSISSLQTSSELNWSAIEFYWWLIIYVFSMGSPVWAKVQILRRCSWQLCTQAFFHGRSWKIQKESKRVCSIELRVNLRHFLCGHWPGVRWCGNSRGATSQLRGWLPQNKSLEEGRGWIPSKDAGWFSSGNLWVLLSVSI